MEAPINCNMLNMRNIIICMQKIKHKLDNIVSFGTMEMQDAIVWRIIGCGSEIG